jgi:RNA polymerase sigma-70 factor (ECF subfamily)
MDGAAAAEDLGPLVVAARGGDPRAFEALVLRFREPLAAFATALLRDRGLAEDAVQEALLLAYREIGGLRDPRRFRSWLYAIVENAALGGLRRRRRRPTVRLRPDAVAEGPPAGDGAEEEGRPRAVVAVRRALDRLPEHYAAILMLRHVDGLSATEAAEVLGISRNNAKMRLRRASRALRRDPSLRDLAVPAVRP